MNGRRKAFRLFMAAAPFLWISAALGADVKVTGGTYAYLGGDSYDPLPNVRIRVIRSGSVFIRDPMSNNDGLFSFPIPPGKPFSLLFTGEKKVPEIQQLASASGMAQHVNVTLLTPEQYVEIYGIEALAAQEARVLGALRDDPETRAEIRGQFERIRPR